jgi:hypothetical protein
MATKKKAGKSKVKVNQLKVKKQKAADVTDKEAKRVRGGLTPEVRGPRRYA